MILNILNQKIPRATINPLRIKERDVGSKPFTGRSLKTYAILEKKGNNVPIIIIQN
jgi:hypothetical protein